MERALLTSLGLDPDLHSVVPRLRPFKGLLIVDMDDKPVRFISERALRKPAVRKAWREAMRAA